MPRNVILYVCNKDIFKHILHRSQMFMGFQAFGKPTLVRSLKLQIIEISLILMDIRFILTKMYKCVFFRTNFK